MCCMNTQGSTETVFFFTLKTRRMEPDCTSHLILRKLAIYVLNDIKTTSTLIYFFSFVWTEIWNGAIRLIWTEIFSTGLENESVWVWTQPKITYLECLLLLLKRVTILAHHKSGWHALPSSFVPLLCSSRVSSPFYLLLWFGEQTRCLLFCCCKAARGPLLNHLVPLVTLSCSRSLRLSFISTLTVGISGFVFLRLLCKFHPRARGGTDLESHPEPCSAAFEDMPNFISNWVHWSSNDSDVRKRVDAEAAVGKWMDLTACLVADSPSLCPLLMDDAVRFPPITGEVSFLIL